MISLRRALGGGGAIVNRRPAALTVMAVALACAGCGGGAKHQSTSRAIGATSATSTGVAATSSSSAGVRPSGALLVSLQTPPGNPRAGAQWPITVHAHSAGGAPVDGVVSYAFLFGGSPVAQRPGGRMRHGTFHDRLEFPAQALGYPLTLEVRVQASGGARGSTTRSVKVER